MDLLTGGLLASLLVLVVLDRVAPARVFPRIRRWRARGLVWLVVSVLLSGALPLLWDPLLAPYRLIDATGLGVAGGTVVGLVALQFCTYWWHRALHRFEPLWRIHQMHHSAERMDVWGAFYLHPLDVAGFAMAGSIGLTLILGVDPLAAAIVNALVTFCSLFQHANLRTPRWLGYVVQRPESHCVHHERGVHAHNYGDIPLWDLVFGTFRNPREWRGATGYWNGASARVGDLLLLRDVTNASSENVVETMEDDALAPTSEPLARTSVV
ncbi:sterol desaturase family protein [Sandaracinus amylolyticus]|uniref:Sterol desaturase n=1 Tax=Sandaracinus amylolyticus TaxID=927083 RepID=A0A0F6W5X2_9BACT|nr:sterol desaturase family protein [Sandaracinus amylolyticus]AKF08242.1 Sterol desaturase [Sandaracinus amylolyticus]